MMAAEPPYVAIPESALLSFTVDRERIAVGQDGYGDMHYVQGRTTATFQVRFHGRLTGQPLDILTTSLGQVVTVDISGICRRFLIRDALLFVDIGIIQVTADVLEHDALSTPPLEPVVERVDQANAERRARLAAQIAETKRRDDNERRERRLTQKRERLAKLAAQLESAKAELDAEIGDVPVEPARTARAIILPED